ncbi:hypothetical protein Tco_0511468 [Tanacetum coccineum]
MTSNSLLEGSYGVMGKYKRGKAKVAWELRGRSFWEVPIRADSSWGWRKLLQLRDTVRPFFVSTLGDGFNLACRVADFGVNGVWNWPQTWTLKVPDIAFIPAPNLDPNKRDVIQWRSKNDWRHPWGPNTKNTAKSRMTSKETYPDDLRRRRTNGTALGTTLTTRHNHKPRKVYSVLLSPPPPQNVARDNTTSRHLSHTPFRNKGPELGADTSHWKGRDSNWRRVIFDLKTNETFGPLMQRETKRDQARAYRPDLTVGSEDEYLHSRHQKKERREG